MAYPKIITLDENGHPVEVPKPLELDLNPDEMTVGDVRMAKGDMRLDASEPGAVATLVVALAGFMRRHTNWTEQDVNGLKLTELVEVAERVRSQERAASVPLASNGSSAPGPEETPPSSPDGPTT